MSAVNCPICDGVIRFENSPKLDQAVLCGSCGMLLVVVSIKPLTLDIAENVSAPQSDRRKDRKKASKERKETNLDDEWDEWEDWDSLGSGPLNKTRSGKSRKGKRARKR